MLVLKRKKSLRGNKKTAKILVKFYKSYICILRKRKIYDYLPEKILL